MSADDRLLLIAVHDGDIVGSFLGMLVVHYFADGLVATDLDLSVAAIPRRRTLATRLLLGYVAWAKALDVAIVQCGNTTIADRDEFSMSFAIRSEEHTSELQSLMRISYAGFCLKKKTILH